MNFCGALVSVLAFCVPASNPNIAAIVAPIVVVITLVAIAAVCGFLYWRKHGFPLRLTVDHDPYDELHLDKREERYSSCDTCISIRMFATDSHLYMYITALKVQTFTRACCGVPHVYYFFICNKSTCISALNR